MTMMIQINQRKKKKLKKCEYSENGKTKYSKIVKNEIIKKEESYQTCKNNGSASSSALTLWNMKNVEKINKMR